MMKSSRRHSRRKGQSMVEFALILVLVAVVCITAITVTGNQLALTFQDIQEAVENPGDAGSQAVYTCPDGTTAVLHGHKYHCH
ncbi:MAG: Flp family type IVb pilin [Chloroflexi bacterium]|nr:MAG: Flp family type IVb pilin [Chloroflexota bacterium]